MEIKAETKNQNIRQRFCKILKQEDSKQIEMEILKQLKSEKYYLKLKRTMFNGRTTNQLHVNWMEEN